MRRMCVFVLACAALAGCDNSSSSTTPTLTPTVPLTKETFTGTVDPQGSAWHNFTIVQTGEVDITLTAAGPPSTIFMGLAVGTPNSADGTCTLISGASVNAQASSSAQLVGTSSPGALCVKIYDVGNQTATITYTITVDHT